MLGEEVAEEEAAAVYDAVPDDTRPGGLLLFTVGRQAPGT